MKLLFIYGPPAAGKLTVANEIAKRTGFKVFHNHLSIDAILPVFEFGSDPFFRLVEMIRVETLPKPHARMSILSTHSVMQKASMKHTSKK